MEDQPEAGAPVHAPLRPNAWASDAGSDSLTNGVRATILLGAEGAALAFGVACLLLGERLPVMLSANGLATAERNAILLGVLCGALLPVAGIAAHAYRHAGEAGKIAESLSRLGLPLLPLAAYPALLRTQIWFQHSLYYLLLLSGFVLLLERCSRSALGALPARFEARLARLTSSDSAKFQGFP